MHGLFFPAGYSGYYYKLIIILKNMRQNCQQSTNCHQFCHDTLLDNFVKVLCLHTLQVKWILQQTLTLRYETLDVIYPQLEDRMRNIRNWCQLGFYNKRSSRKSILARRLSLTQSIVFRNYFAISFTKSLCGWQHAILKVLMSAIPEGSLKPYCLLRAESKIVEIALANQLFRRLLLVNPYTNEQKNVNIDVSRDPSIIINHFSCLFIGC